MVDVIRTLRIKKEYDPIIKADAKKDGVSVNTFFNRLLEKFIMTYRFIDSFPCLIIPCEIVKEFLEEIPEEKISNAAKSMGFHIPKHSLFLKGKDPTLNNVLELMEKVVSHHSNWYQFNSQINNGKIKLLLRHNLGKNWSIFLDMYYRAMFEQFFNFTLKTEVGADSLVIKISNTQNNNKNKNDHSQNTE